MNYFGLFFTFMVPGIILGIMCASVLMRRTTRKSRQTAFVKKSKRRLYVCDLRDEAVSKVA
ncbi:MAG: hypothetical protein RR232_03670 [Clostridia bacterium]